MVTTIHIGQGLNCGFEDVRLLMELLDKHDKFAPIEPLLNIFAKERKNDVHEICDLALNNYIEMRHGVTSPVYKLRKKTEDTLHKWMPSTIIPLYTMVSFSNIPYHKARKQHDLQTKLFFMFLVTAITIPFYFVLV